MSDDEDTATVLGPIGTLLEQAYSYAGMGFEIFPANPTDKTPLVSQYKATTDLDTIEAWWKQWPDALIGHRISPDQIILDIDPRHGGDQTWTALLAEMPVLHTRTHFSGRHDNGHHVWLLRPADELTITGIDQWAKERGLGQEILDDQGRSTGRWVSGIDLLHHKHRYTILPPSHHPETGRPYYWGKGRGWNISVAPPPQLLVDLLVRDTEVRMPVAAGPQFIDPTSIADLYSRETSWRELLERHRWTLVGGDGENDGSRWRHPQATTAFSATIKHGCLFVYSPNTPFEVTYPDEPKGYTPFRAFAVLEHDKDLSAAGRAARELYPFPSTTDDTATPLDEAPMFVDWKTLWAAELPGEEWLIEGVIALRRAHVIYARHKQGKSLYALWSATRLAIERDDVDVVYLDYEMTEADLRERLESFGYDAGVDLSRLHYALLPMLPPLDTAEGATALLGVLEGVRRAGCELYVVIDTTGRAVQGEENSNDTIRAFYRWTGSALKRAGVTWARLDHAGKDESKGQRGGSAKGDDVDVIWKLVAGDDGMTLYRDASRMSWIPERVAFTMTTTPLAYWAAERVVPIGTHDAIEDLDALEVPPSASVESAMEALRTAGKGRRKTVVAHAQRSRRERVQTFDFGASEAREPLGNRTPRSSLGTAREPMAGNGLSPGAEPNGNRREPHLESNGSRVPPPMGEPGPDRSDDPLFDSCRFVAGSLYCINDPCPNPNHRSQG